MSWLSIPISVDIRLLALIVNLIIIIIAFVIYKAFQITKFIFNAREEHNSLQKKLIELEQKLENIKTILEQNDFIKASNTSSANFEQDHTSTNNKIFTKLCRINKLLTNSFQFNKNNVENCEFNKQKKINLNDAILEFNFDEINEHTTHKYDDCKISDNQRSKGGRVGNFLTRVLPKVNRKLICKQNTKLLINELEPIYANNSCDYYNNANVVSTQSIDNSSRPEHHNQSNSFLDTMVSISDISNELYLPTDDKSSNFIIEPNTEKMKSNF